MSWDEIDFDLIVPGMITRGPAEVSFAEYLQQFATAGDERQNLIGENPTITGLTFTAGEIRNTIFWDKYRALISQYRAIMFGFDSGRRGSIYYEREVLTDTTNFSQYAIDFQVLLGNDLFNKISNPNSFSNTELFTAEVLNGLYTIYQNTEIIGNTDVIVTGKNSPVLNTPTTIDNTGDYYEAIPETGAAGGTFTDLEPINWVSKPSNTLRATYAFFFFSASTQFGFGAQWRWSTFGDTFADNPNDLIRNKNGIDIALEMRDLDNNILEMDFVGFGNMTANVFDPATVGAPSTAFNPNHAFKKFGQSVIKVEWEIVTTSHTAAGTTKSISVSEPSPIENRDMPDPSAGPVGKGSAQRLIIGIGQGNLNPIFIDLNNPALEFFIDNS